MITKEQALEALENMDDCARIGMGVNPIGPYNVLKAFVEQASPAIALVWPYCQLESNGGSGDFGKETR